MVKITIENLNKRQLYKCQLKKNNESAFINDSVCYL